jgi:lysine-specific demethylase 8
MGTLQDAIATATADQARKVFASFGAHIAALFGALSDSLAAAAPPTTRDDRCVFLGACLVEACGRMVAITRPLPSSTPPPAAAAVQAQAEAQAEAEALRLLDLGIMVAPPDEGGRLAVPLAEVVHASLMARAATPGGAGLGALGGLGVRYRDRRWEDAGEAAGTIGGGSSPASHVVAPLRISTVRSPSLLAFRDGFLVPGLPVVLQGLTDRWPAMGARVGAEGGAQDRDWSRLPYLLEHLAFRTVPVEVGTDYLGAQWTQRLMPFHAFLEAFLFPQAPAAAVGYLAQHRLLEQVPELARDAPTPDYCCLSRGDEEADPGPVTVHAWMGPAGTVSRLHYDRQQNILCQVVGRKRLRLYAPEHSHALLPCPPPLHNTSAIDAEACADGAFRALPFHEVELGPGDALFLPAGWWHHVRSLAPSISLSFWWD